MPTGYTSIVPEGATFEQFVWRCARAFGALIEMRDEPMDAPIPEHFGVTNYYAEELAKAKEEKARLEHMTGTECLDFGAQAKRDAIAACERTLENIRKENASYEAMWVRVQEWQPPTKEHVGLKKFMLEQLETSLTETDYFERSLTEAKDKSPSRYWSEAVEHCEWLVKYHTEKQGQDNECTQERNEWVAALRQSVPYAETTG